MQYRVVTQTVETVEEQRIHKKEEVTEARHRMEKRVEVTVDRVLRAREEDVEEQVERAEGLVGC